jgi:hypothetical protein
MATLFDQQIDQTYQGLIKTTDNGVLGAVEKEITDGLGNTSTLKLGTTSASFTGDLDLTGATVTGIPASGVQSVVAGTNITIDDTDPANPIVNATGGGAGLVNGTVADSIKSADSLTTIPSTSTATNAIAIGNGADATQTKNIVLGTGNAGSSTMIVIGDATGPEYAETSIAIGNNMPTDLAFRGNSVSVGHGVYPSQNGVYIGNNSNHTAGGNTHCVAVGFSATTSANQTISLGANTLTTANDSVAIGYGVTASTANTVTIKKLQMLDYATLDYADDAAAATGGIPLGGVYHTSGALKIRIV